MAMLVGLLSYVAGHEGVLVGRAEREGGPLESTSFLQHASSIVDNAQVELENVLCFNKVQQLCLPLHAILLAVANYARQGILPLLVMRVRVIVFLLLTWWRVVALIQAWEGRGLVTVLARDMSDAIPTSSSFKIWLLLNIATSSRTMSKVGGTSSMMVSFPMEASADD
jgi:hypothetical protein